jgi:hypothetical protein
LSGNALVRIPFETKTDLTVGQYFDYIKCKFRESNYSIQNPNIVIDYNLQNPNIVEIKE